jgi:hypothetical protein
MKQAEPPLKSNGFWVWLVAVSVVWVGTQATQELAKIADRINDVEVEIGLQAAQQTWLVQHYAEPKRPLFLWEKSKCRWCGQWVREDGEHEEEK